MKWGSKDWNKYRVLDSYGEYFLYIAKLGMRFWGYCEKAVSMNKYMMDWEIFNNINYPEILKTDPEMANIPQRQREVIYGIAEYSVKRYYYIHMKSKNLNKDKPLGYIRFGPGKIKFEDGAYVIDGKTRIHLEPIYKKHALPPNVEYEFKDMILLHRKIKMTGKSPAVVLPDDYDPDELFLYVQLKK